MFSLTVEYALRAVVHLADAADEAPLTTKQVALQTSIPVGYLSKVFQALSKAGLVTSQRGLHGGHRLAWDPEEVTLLEVINAIEPVRRIERCPLELVEHQIALCPLHQRLDDAAAYIEASFEAINVAELLADMRARRKSCPFPRHSP